MVSTKMFDLSGSVAVVTGGNGGIGRGIALPFSLMAVTRSDERCASVSNQRVTKK